MPERLWRVFAELSQLYPKISLRGVGPSCEIHLENKDRIVTISDIKGGWWFERSQLPNRGVREGLFHTKDEVLRAVREWLK